MYFVYDLYLHNIIYEFDPIFDEVYSLSQMFDNYTFFYIIFTRKWRKLYKKIIYITSIIYIIYLFYIKYNSYLDLNKYKNEFNSQITIKIII